MFAKLFKPKWQHKDARVRIQALANLATDSSELTHLAQNDPDTGVRLEAIARLTHLPTLIDLGQRSDSIGERARGRVVGLAANQNQYDEQLVTVFDWLSSNENVLKTLVADQQRHVELRKPALALIEDEDQLYQIAYDDPSREIQFIAANRITDIDKLKMLEKRHGKQNKRLRQLLKERLEVEEERQQFIQSLEACCEELEQLGQHDERWAQDKTQLLVLKQRWQQFENVPEEFVKRFADAEKQFQCRLNQHEEEEQQLQPLRAAFDALLTQAKQQLEQLESAPETIVLADFDPAFAANQTHWQNQTALPEKHQAELDQQWEKLNQKIQSVRNALSDDLQAVEQLRLVISHAQKMQQRKKSLISKRVLELQSEWTSIKRPQNSLRHQTEELELTFQKSMSALNARLKKESQDREQLTTQLQNDLQQLEQFIAEEQYSHAIDLYQKTRQQLQDDNLLPKKDLNQFTATLQRMTPQINEWRDWRRWGTDQAREHLIESAEHLSSEETLDPQERAKRVQSMRKEWRKLNEMEPGQQHKLWKTFDEKVTAAYEPSKQHFEQQAQQRQINLDKRTEICVSLEEIHRDTDWQHVDWRDAQQRINQQRKKWKQAGSVSHKDWQVINERFNHAMDALEVFLAQERSQNWKERLELVEQVEALLELEDLQEATEQAKQLQSQWHISVPSRQGDEQRLWKRFRAPMDQLFNQLKEQRNSARSEQQAAIEQKEALCVQLESWLELDDEEFMTLAPQYRNLKADFEAITGLPNHIYKKLESRWQQAAKNLQLRKRQIKLNQQLQALDSAQPTANEANPADQEGEKLCLQLEILLDIDTPEAYQEQRMQYQVARLSESMTSLRDEVDPQEQALKLLKQWHTLGMSTEAIAAQQPRIQIARENLMSTTTA